MVDETENVDDSNISINDRSQDMVDNSNLYHAEGLDESSLFQDVEGGVFDSNLSSYNECSEEDDVVLMSQELESDSNIVQENDELEFLSFLFSKMEIDHDEFIEHYDGDRTLRRESLQSESSRYSQMEFEDV